MTQFKSLKYNKLQCSPKCFFSIYCCCALIAMQLHVGTHGVEQL